MTILLTKYDQWLAEHPGEKYPHGSNNLYSCAEWIDLGFHVDAEKLERILE